MEEKDKQFGLGAFVFFSIAASFLYLLAVTWLKWGHLIVDTSREFWVPLQLLEGKILYKDVFYEYGFFPPYFLALLYKLFGVRIGSLVGCGIGITMLMSLLLYKISRFFLDELISGLVVLTFLFVFAFGYYFEEWSGIFNFILPYSFASTFFMLFVTFAVYWFLKFLFSEKEIYLLLWSLCLSFAVFSRIELSVMILIGFGLIGGLFLLQHRGTRRWRWGIYLLSPVVISCLGYVIFLWTMQASGGFQKAIISLIVTLKQDPFNLRTMGINTLSLNSLLMVKSLLLHILIIFFIWIGSFSMTSFFSRKENTPFFLVLGGCALLLAFQISQSRMNLDLQYRSLPLILVIGIVLSVTNIVRAVDVKRHFALLTVYAISLAAMVRIVFNATCFGYGFFMLDLGLIGYYLFFFEIITRPFKRYLKEFSWGFLAFMLLCYFLFLISAYWQTSVVLYAQKSVKLETERGTLYSWNTARTKRFWEAIVYLKENTAPEDTVVVLPEGVGLNFFAQRENPTGYPNFSPPIFRLLGEQNMISRFRQVAVDYIVIVHRLSFEYSLPAFGIHYGKEIYAWIIDNYRLVKLIGPYPFTSDEFGIAIFKKK